MRSDMSRWRGDCWFGYGILERNHGFSCHLVLSALELQYLGHHPRVFPFFWFFVFGARLRRRPYHPFFNSYATVAASKPTEAPDPAVVDNHILGSGYTEVTGSQPFLRQLLQQNQCYEQQQSDSTPWMAMQKLERGSRRTFLVDRLTCHPTVTWSDL